MSTLLLQLEQRTEPWRVLRRVGATGNPYACALGCSELAPLLGLSPYGTAEDLWQLKTLGIEREVTQEEAYIRRRGQLREPALLAWYQKKAQNPNVQPAVVVDQDRPWLIASLDGLDGQKNRPVEIKVAAKPFYWSFAAGTIPVHWRVQVHGQMVTLGVEEAVLVVEPYTVSEGPVLAMTVDLDDVSQYAGAGEVLALAESFCAAVTEGRPWKGGVNGW